MFCSFENQLILKTVFLNNFIMDFKFGLIWIYLLFQIFLAANFSVAISLFFYSAYFLF